jgi:hypothetical protein
MHEYKAGVKAGAVEGMAAPELGHPLILLELGKNS